MATLLKDVQGASVACGKCGGELAVDDVGAPDFRPCPWCAAPNRSYAFPALLRPLTSGAASEKVALDGEATCFHHPENRAVVPCSTCGRFLCALCDLELDGEHLCPPCLESGHSKGTLSKLENRRVLYDSIAMSTSILSMLIFYLTVFTAPFVLFLSYRHWNTPSSIVPRGRWRFLVAVTISLLQLAGWTALAALFIAA